MQSILRILVVAGFFSLTATSTLAAAEIVIAIRYLQAEGTSHSHLYLYREDEKLLRQLTNDNSVQDAGPIFAPDGASIVFVRVKANDLREFWSVDPLGKTPKKLDAAPDWYVAAKSSPYFTNIEPEESTSATPAPSPAATPVPVYKSPDNSVELVLREDPKDEDDQMNGPGHGKHVAELGHSNSASRRSRVSHVYGESLCADPRQQEDGELLLHGTLGRKVKQDSLRTREKCRGLLRRVDVSARPHAIDNHDTQKLELKPS